MPVKVKEGHPMLPARRVMKGWGDAAFAWAGATRAGWRQICGKAMAHYYERGCSRAMCGVKVTKAEEPQRGVPVPACKACVKAGAPYH